MSTKAALPSTMEKVWGEQGMASEGQNRREEQTLAANHLVLKPLPLQLKASAMHPPQHKP